MTKTRFSRRDFLRVGSAAAAGTILAACGGAAAPAAKQPTAAPAAQPAAEQPTAAPAAQPAAAEGVTIQWWVGWGNLTAAIDKIKQTPQFKEMIGKNTLEFKPSVKAEALLTAIAGGTPPDGASNADYPNLWSRGALTPVDEMISTSSVIKKDDILPKLWDSAIYDGKMIGVPGLESYLWWGLNYNTDAATKAGLDPTKAPETWDDAMTWHKALTKFDAAGNLKQFGLDPYDAMAGETDFGIQSFGGMNWWDEQNRKINLNNDAMVQCLGTCAEFIKLVGPDKFAGMRQDQNLGGWGASYNAGVQNMIIEGYWHPGETQIQKPEIAKFNVAGWAPVPASRKGAKIMATGSHLVVLFKDGKHTPEMYKVAEHMVTDSALDIIFKEVGWIFGKNSWLQKVDANAYPGLKFYIDAPSQVTEWIIGRRCPIHGFVQTQYQELREKVYRGDMTPKDAAAEMQTRADTEWKNQGLK